MSQTVEENILNATRTEYWQSLYGGMSSKGLQRPKILLEERFIYWTERFIDG